MLRWQTITGVLVGLVLGFAVLGLIGRPEKRLLPSGPLISECDGALRELVVHYDPAAKNAVANTYRQFIEQLGSNVTVHVVCSNRAAFDDFTSNIGQHRCAVLPLLVGHAITTWSRDRWIAFGPPTAGGATTIWSPRGEAGEEIWPARAGDERVGDDIASALAPKVRARRSPLYFDGGDFLADNETVFIVPRVLARNVQHTVSNREEFLRLLAAECKRRVILLEQAPDHHAGMFMASIGEKRMLVGDPSLGKQLIPPPTTNAAGGLAEPREFMGLPGGPDFTPETQHLFDAVAAQCAREGYQVFRIPTVPARDGRTYLTYVNVLLEQQGKERLIYLPQYAGVEALNAAAKKTWEELGYTVRTVDCTGTYRHFGCLHCLVNVLRRS